MLRNHYHCDGCDEDWSETGDAPRGSRCPGCLADVPLVRSESAESPGSTEGCPECEVEGFYYTGVPGVLARMENGKVAVGAKVERCDACCLYPDDRTAREIMTALGLCPADEFGAGISGLE